jgi:hypothetical protein
LRNIWKNRRQPLRIEKIHQIEDTFVPRDILITKGSRSAKISSCGLKDLREANNLNPAVELAYCVKQELEGAMIDWKTGDVVTPPMTLLKRKDLVRIATVFEAIRRDLPWQDLLDT